MTILKQSYFWTGEPVNSFPLSDGGLPFNKHTGGYTETVENEQLYNMSGGGKGFEEKASKGVRLMMRVGIGVLCTLVWKAPDEGIFE